MLQATDVTVKYGRRPVLNHVTITARPGQLTAIVGPNGSGKTALLRALAGEVGTTGQITMNGQNLQGLDAGAQARHRAVLPQATQIAFPFTLHELVRLGLSAGQPGPQAARPRELIQAAIARVGLAGHEHRLVQQLSGGERQRAQLARVLVQVWAPVLDGLPRWLLLDEPVSALDIGHQLSIMALARDFARAGGGVVAVMHDLNLTAMFADHIALLAEGRLRRSGPPSEVLNDADLSACYGCPLRINTAPPGPLPWLLPQATAH